MRRALQALFLCLAILSGIVGTASGAYVDATSKNRVGVSGQYPNIRTYVLGSLELEPQRGDTILGYDPATGVVFYVNQNPWTKFDPEGLEEDEGVDVSLFRGGNLAERTKSLSDETKDESPSMSFNELQHESIPEANESAKRANESAEQQIEEVRDGLVDASIETASMVTDVIPGKATATAGVGMVFVGGKWIKEAGERAIKGIKSLFKKSATKTESTLAERILTARRTGSGLKNDSEHLAASFLTKEQLDAGTSFSITGGDGVVRELLQTPGGMDGKSGIFEYILDPKEGVTHQRFIPGGKITGLPNQK